MIELQKCPFCGGEADGRNVLGKYGWAAQVYCRVCGASTKLCKFRNIEDLNDPAYDQSIDAWNRRVSNAKKDS